MRRDFHCRPTPLLRLIAAAVSLKLISRRSDGRFGLGPLGAALVGNDAVAAMVRHHAILYRDLENPVALLRGEPAETGLSRYWAYARSTHPDRLSSDRVTGYTNLMATSQAMIAEEILAAYPLYAGTGSCSMSGVGTERFSPPSLRAHRILA